MGVINTLYPLLFLKPHYLKSITIVLTVATIAINLPFTDT